MSSNFDIKKMSRELHIDEEDLARIIGTSWSLSVEKLAIALKIKYYESDNESEKRKIATEWDSSSLRQAELALTAYECMQAYFNSRQDSPVKRKIMLKWVSLCKKRAEAKQATVYAGTEADKNIAFAKLLDLCTNVDSLLEIIYLTNQNKNWYDEVLKKIVTLYKKK